MDYRGSDVERQMIASQLARDIRVANFLAKQTDSPRRRRNLYSLKHRKLSLGISHFAEYFKLLSIDIDGTGNLFVLIHLPTGKSVHAPFENLSDTAQDEIRSILTARLNTNPHVPLAA